MAEDINQLYWSFYIEGRRAKLLKGDVDADELAQSLLDDRTKTVREVIDTATAKVAVTLDGSKVRRKWFSDHEDDFDDEMTLSKDDAYKAFCRGRTDELSYALEVEVIDAIEALLDPENEEEDEEDDDDEEEEDEEE